MHSSAVVLRATRCLCPLAFVLFLLVSVSAARPALPDPEASTGVSAEPVRPLISRFQSDPKGEADRLLLSSGFSFRTSVGEPVLPAELRSSAPLSPNETVSLLVQVEAPVQEGVVRAIRSAGARIESFIPRNAFLVRVRAGDRAALAAVPGVRWVGDYHPAYRISAQESTRLPGGRADFTLLLFDDGDTGAVSGRITELGGEVEMVSANGINRAIRCRVDRSRIVDLAAHPAVRWIEPTERPRFQNADVQWVNQTFVSGDRKVWDEGIDGTGQVVMVGDSGIRTSHNMFRDDAVPITEWGQFPTHRKVIAYEKAAPYGDILFGDTSGASYHGTHTCGTVAGDDSPHGGSSNDGIAKGAKIYFVDAGGSTNGLYLPGDLNDYFQPAYDGNAGGAARISSNSWGSTSAGAYTISCMQTDQFSWSHKDFLICVSNGNSGSVGSVGSPASAKSILSSGGTKNGSWAGQIYTSTSRGPTVDGRTKPTVCSPGQSVRSASGSNDAGYQYMSGTSMSCPNLAASAALLRQYFMEGWYPTGGAVAANAITPTASLLKAMLVNSGVDNFSSYSIPDMNIGWGRILLDQVMYFPGDGRRTLVVDATDGVATGEAHEYTVRVTDPSEDLKVTLVWTDYPGDPAAAVQLVNDIDLEVSHAASTWLGNVWSGGQSSTGGSADSLNVEENVRRATPTAGEYTIRVLGANVPFGAQPYALVVSGGIGGSAGVLTLDASSYAPSQAVGIRVEDTDAGSVSVTVASTTEPAGETVALTGGSGVHTGSVALSLGVAAPGDGLLSVSHGDAVTVTYLDANPSGVVTAAAMIDADDPGIGDVAAVGRDISATISWTTDAPADSRVEYGTTPALGNWSTLDTLQVISHAHELSGLSPLTTYYFDVVSTDHAGNTVRDDFDGGHYRVTTGTQADVLLVIADDTFIEDQAYEDAFARTGWTFNTWRKAQATEPEVGDSSTGLRSYRAVWWQVGWEQYPQFLRPARDSLSVYHDGGGRLAVVSHDVSWAFANMGSGFWSPVKAAWLNDYLHTAWNSDPTTWTANIGVAGDPISDPYAAGISYTPYRDGGAGDEVSIVDGSGSGAASWSNDDLFPGDIGIRWESASPNGTPGDGVWGGTPTKYAGMYFEWSRINAGVADDADRAEILDRTLQWLVGGDHPDVAVVGPNGGEAVSSGPVDISWTATADAATGRAIDTVSIQMSDDGGQSWSLLTDAPGASPYSWDVSALPTSDLYRVRVVVTDDGDPTLFSSDASDGVFTIAIPGNETRGPVVRAGSPSVAPFPVAAPGNAVLTAVVSDSLTGGSPVDAAEWSVGAAAAAAGSGTAMSGSFGAVVVAVSDTVDASLLPVGDVSVWIRGRDAAGNWGTAREFPIRVNGDATGVAVHEAATAFSLSPSTPNPFHGSVRIGYAVPTPSRVRLSVFDVGGRLVARLLDGPVSAGRHHAVWDGRDAHGSVVAPGVYFCRYEAGDFRAEGKLVRVR
ncbi:MAG: S8 family serine peptidase [Gemmatimonadota bacterium]|nr:S8 family serine peptidase [Gemmatimonadota bacterium]